MDLRSAASDVRPRRGRATNCTQRSTFDSFEMLHSQHDLLVYGLFRGHTVLKARECGRGDTSEVLRTVDKRQTTRCNRSNQPHQCAWKRGENNSHESNQLPIPTTARTDTKQVTKRCDEYIVQVWGSGRDPRPPILYFLWRCSTQRDHAQKAYIFRSGRRNEKSHKSSRADAVSQATPRRLGTSPEARGELGGDLVGRQFEGQDEREYKEIHQEVAHTTVISQTLLPELKQGGATIRREHVVHT